MKCADLSLKWVKLCKRPKNFNVTTARLCTLHFEPDDYERDLKNELMGFENKFKRSLKYTALPSLRLPNNTLQSSRKMEMDNARKNRLEIRARKKLVQDLIENSLVVMDENNNDQLNVEINSSSTSTSNERRSIGTLTENNDNNEEVIKKLQAKVTDLEDKMKSINKIFTPKQLSKLCEPHKRITWSVDEISKAIVIHSSEPRAYRLLLKNGYPFPAVSTLTRESQEVLIANRDVLYTVGKVLGNIVCL
ncbi:hypothetical protein ABEB36_013626 [Hypothenemus hampei]|uniref:THAP-type domain-containing protein n=1 Tax=Hypothenemus hampei TaxID=57062 RepID=A0ABD1E4S6_HYPHA